ncbi:helix-turn-helix domain-containing protein [Streptomyces halstedii]|uniref:helix-turn-helix domain-containing protein n=1 Tax=Streptomyces halstedii TaxID=1944 RepID=UPI0036BD6789
MAVPAPKKLDPTQSLTALYGSMLRKFRTKAGWTQRELGDRIPIAHSRIAQFELGNETPVPDVAQALAGSRVPARGVGRPDPFRSKGKLS